MKIKNALKVIVVTVVLALSCAALAGCGDDQSNELGLVQKGKLTVASSLDFPPFESLDGDKPVGFEVALIQEIADRLDLELEIKNTKFDTIISAIAAGGKFDVGMSGITIDPEREKLVNFTTPYYIVDQAIVVMNGSYKNVKQLKGKKIAAQSGTTGLTYAEENVSDNVVAYDEATACFAALQAGNVEAVAIDLPVAEYMLKAYPDAVILKRIATGEEYGMCVNKDNEKLLEAINGAIADIKSDGLLEKYENEYIK